MMASPNGLSQYAAHLLVLVSVLLLHSARTVALESVHDVAQHEDKQQRKLTAIQYKRLTLTQIYTQMDTLASNYPEFVTVTSTQDEFGLPSPCGNSAPQNDGCKTRYLVIEDSLIYSSSRATKALKRRPDVFLSGTLHGDERVGPVAMIEVANLLVLAAACESGKSTQTGCDDFYAKYTPQQAAWLARLVSTRRIVILPAANSKGYYDGTRGEGRIDPNRDFAFDNDPTQCMRTIAARSINELFLKYLFQMSMTYHGGIENITFEWGALSVPFRKLSPDDTAQRILAKRMSYYAGELYSSNVSDQFYETGDINDVLYGVYGGFEDWAYAGSWEKNLAVKCTPSTYGGYDISKTTYDDVSLSTFNVLMEISRSKNPGDALYGSENSLLNAPFKYDNNVDNGYATKTIRTALMSIDVVEPYVEITRAKSKRFYQELKPLRVLKNRWSDKKKKITTADSSKPKIYWSVGGSFSVDETFLLYGKWSDLPLTFDSINQPSHDDIIALMNNDKFFKTGTQAGSTRWSDPMSGAIPTFTRRVKTSRFSSGDRLAVIAVAKVDQSWSQIPNNSWPTNTGTQSHMVNGRTDPNYNKGKTGREVQGCLYWISVPLTIKIK